MMYKKLPTLKFIEILRFPYLSITATFLVLTLLTCTAYTETSYGQVNRYWVGLVPEVVSDGIGFVGFKYSDDFNELIYTVNVHNIDNITGVYLYLKNDTQGTIPVLDLLKKPRESNREDDRWSNKTKDGQLTGTINLTGVTKKDLTGTMDGKSIEYLLKLMREGKLYIAVYTKDHAHGELGEIRLLVWTTYFTTQTNSIGKSLSSQYPILSITNSWKVSILNKARPALTSVVVDILSLKLYTE